MRARIQQLIEHQHMNRQSFAEHIGVSPASLSQILNDKQKPTLAIVIAITNRFPALRYDWLLDGKEPMFTDGTTSDKKKTIDLSAASVTPEIKGTPFAKYVITNLTGKADSKYLTITFTCAGAFDVNYQGRLIIEK